MIGICAPNVTSGLDALKLWLADLGLPKNKLYGMDVDGKPAQAPEGAVFIKYNSDSGNADLSGYAFQSRGVLFTPELADGVFRQYAYLPLDLPATNGNSHVPIGCPAFESNVTNNVQREREEDNQNATGERRVQPVQQQSRHSRTTVNFRPTDAQVKKLEELAKTGNEQARTILQQIQNI